MSSKFLANADSIAVKGTSLDELVERMSELVEAGRDDGIQALIDQHPKHANRLRNLLPAIEAMASVDGISVEEVVGTGESGRQLGDFRLIREIGRGGMGVVYEAEQLSLARHVALKVLPLAATLTPQQLERFKNEARAAATLRHSHIVGVYSVGVERGVHYYAMELIEGQSLAQAIAELSHQTTDAVEEASPDAETATVAGLSTVRTRSPQKYFRDMARVLADAADAIDYAHNQGVLHRDIKPANLMLDSQSHVWVTDFGLARLESDAGVTMTGDILGTLRYMSPEQAAGRSALVDYRTDIHALGATLYELVALKPAFAGTERADVLRRVIETPPRPLRQVDSRVPADLETIVSKAMEKDSADRYQTAGELAADLRAFAEQRAITAKPSSLATKINRWVRRHTALTAAALAVLLLAIGGLGAALAVIDHERNATANALNESEQSLQIANKAVQEAEQNLKYARESRQIARQAVDDMYTGIATSWMTEDSDLTPTKHEFLTKAADIYRRLADEAPDDPQSQWDAGIAYARLGRIEYRLARVSEAVQAYDQSIAIREPLLTQLDDTVEGRIQIAMDCRNLADMYINQELLDAARGALKSAQNLLTPIARSAADRSDYQRLSAEVDFMDAQLLLRDRRLEKAEPLVRAADSIYTQLHKADPGSMSYRRGYYRSRLQMAWLLRYQGKLEEAADIVRDLDSDTSLLMREAFDSAPLERLRIATIVELADIQLAAGQTAEALETLDRARDRALSSFEGRTPPTLLLLHLIQGKIEWTRVAEPVAICQFNEIETRRGRVLGVLGQYYEAQQTLADVVRTNFVLGIDRGTTQFAIGETNARVCLAEVLRQAGSPESAAVAASAAREWRQLLSERPDTVSYISDIYPTSDLACFLELFPEQRATIESKQSDDAPRQFNEGLAVLEVANGVNWLRAGGAEPAIGFLERFAAVDSGADSYAWFYLAMAHAELGNDSEADQMYQQAVQWMEAHKPDNEELAALRDRAAEKLGMAAENHHSESRTSKN